MKKGFVAITAALALAASTLIGTSIAGIGPDRGLPNVDVAALSTTADMYQVNDTSVPGVQGSAMCVACHSRNPARKTAYNQGHTPGSYVGSHFVTRNFADTSEGGGYTDNPTVARARAARLDTPIYMANAPAAWPAAPKYGNGSATSIDNNITNPTAGARAQMICESCHNIVRNIGPAKLLATGFANGAASTAYTVGAAQALTGHVAGGGTEVPALCIGCHGNMSAGVSAEWQLHPIRSGEATAYVGTHHHRNTGATGTNTDYFGSGTQTGAHNMGLISQGYYTFTGTGLQMWGANYGEVTDTTPRALTYNVVTNKKMQPTIVGTAAGQIVVAAGTQVLCTNCHRGHNAATTGGGTIVMVTGTGTALGSGGLDNATLGMGIVGRDTHLANTNPLCLACHQ